MTILSSLTNRIFLGSALLAVFSIGVAIYNVHVAVTARAEEELNRGLEEAGTLVDEYRRLLIEHFSREARLVADLPRLKAAVALGDPPTVQPIAAEYRHQLEAALIVVTDPAGRVLAEAAEDPAVLTARPDAARAEATLGRESTALAPHPAGILQVVSVPVWIDPRQPEILGTLSVGFSFDQAVAARFRALTNSEVAFVMEGRVRAATLPPDLWARVAPLAGQEGVWPAVPLGAEDYVAAARPLGGDPAAHVVVLRSRTERLRFLSALHRTLGITAVVAVLVATLLSYGIARTVTRPLAAVTAAMRETAATGDLTRRIAEPAPGPLLDEDARVLAATYNRMTDSIARFQREAADRERLSSLGRLSTVIAHEIRNPLMIIKAAARTLRQEPLDQGARLTAVGDIEEEVVRLNRVVADVLDFARPVAVTRAPVDLNALCADAARAATTASPVGVRLSLDPGLRPVLTDGERLRLALVNILTNARHAVLARAAAADLPDAIAVLTRQERSTVRIEIADRGAGIASPDLPKIFEPYFTTRRGGTGLGLAISRNIVEALGGTIAITSREHAGTTVRIDLPAGEEVAT